MFKKCTMLAIITPTVVIRADEITIMVIPTVLRHANVLVPFVEFLQNIPVFVTVAETSAKYAIKGLIFYFYKQWIVSTKFAIIVYLKINSSK